MAPKLNRIGNELAKLQQTEFRPIEFATLLGLAPITPNNNVWEKIKVEPLNAEGHHVIKFLQKGGGPGIYAHLKDGILIGLDDQRECPLEQIPGDNEYITVADGKLSIHAQSILRPGEHQQNTRIYTITTENISSKRDGITTLEVLDLILGANDNGNSSFNIVSNLVGANS
ncbi:hypothetical protein IT417_03535 [bacterium]|nr:hypothetical protein [bacterium]